MPDSTVKSVATTVANRIVVPGWQRVFLRVSFLLGTFAAVFFDYVLYHAWALDKLMWAVHHIPGCADATPLGMAKIIASAVPIAMFFKQGGGKKVVVAWEDLSKAADAQAGSMQPNATAVAYEPKAFGPPTITSTAAASTPATTGVPAP